MKDRTSIGDAHRAANGVAESLHADSNAGCLRYCTNTFGMIASGSPRRNTLQRRGQRLRARADPGARAARRVRRAVVGRRRTGSARCRRTTCSPDRPRARLPFLRESSRAAWRCASARSRPPSSSTRPICLRLPPGPHPPLPDRVDPLRRRVPPLRRPSRRTCRRSPASAPAPCARSSGENGAHRRIEIGVAAVAPRLPCSSRASSACRRSRTSVMHDADRAGQRGGLRDDRVRRHGDVVAARRGDVGHRRDRPA